MTAIEIVLGLIAAAGVLLHFVPRKPTDPAVLQKVEKIDDDVWTWIADHLKGHAAPATSIPAAIPGESASGVVSAIPLSPQMALSLGQMGVQDLRYYLFLRGLSLDALNAWVSVFLSAANATVTPGMGNVATVVDPITKTPVFIPSDAWATLVRLNQSADARIVTA